jgi:hypothetical protein
MVSSVDLIIDNPYHNPILVQCCKAMDEAFSRLRQDSYDNVCDAIKSLEAKFVSGSSNNAFVILEVRRCAAERLLILAIENKRPWEECVNLFSLRNSLGFSDIPAKSLLWIVFVQYCNNAEKTNIGLRLLQLLNEELDGLIKQCRESHVNVTQLIGSGLGSD